MPRTLNGLRARQLAVAYGYPDKEAAAGVIAPALRGLSKAGPALKQFGKDLAIWGGIPAVAIGGVTAYNMRHPPKVPEITGGKVYEYLEKNYPVLGGSMMLGALLAAARRGTPSQILLGGLAGGGLGLGGTLLYKGYKK